jgi:hypothetical protein
MLIETRHFEWNLREIKERAEAADQAEAEGKHEVAALLRENPGGHPFMEADQMPESCFYCSERLTIPCVYWHGSFGLGLHRHCAKELAGHLITDSERPCQESEGGDKVR